MIPGGSEAQCQGLIDGYGMLQMHGLSKTRTPNDTCEKKGWYLIDSDHALPPIARR